MPITVPRATMPVKSRNRVRFDFPASVFRFGIPGGERSAAGAGQ